MDWKDALLLLRQRWKVIVVVVALIAASFGVGLSVEDRDGNGTPDRVVIERHVAPPATAVDGPDADTARDDALPLSTAAQGVLEDAAAGDTADELADPLREGDDGPVVLNEGPLAAQEFPGCRTRFVANSSSRNGAKPSIIVWHQTVSRERGQASQDALTAFANSRASGVSWHFLIGRTNGLCTFSVPLNLKAWTQANANPWAFGIEVEAVGDEGVYVKGDGREKLLAVTRELGRRFGIPMRRGAVDGGCRPTRSGIVEHSDLGACGGGHVDVTLSGVDGLIDAAARTPITARHRATCKKVHAFRHGERSDEKRQAERVRFLRRAGLGCVKGRPVRQ